MELKQLTAKTAMLNLIKGIPYKTSGAERIFLRVNCQLLKNVKTHTLKVAHREWPLMNL